MASNNDPVSISLSAALANAEKMEQEKKKEVLKFECEKDRLIIFSDLHKGTRDGADDFRFSERAYNAALAYYYLRGYTLVSLGDVEEMWENRLKPVLNSYAYTLALEGRFHQDGRLWRVWGNHDDVWGDAKATDKLLRPAFKGGDKPVDVRDAFLLHVYIGGKERGRLLLLHGHQGTPDSEQFPAISRFFVRNIWRPIQRLTKISPNTPSKDWKLRQSHNIALYKWASRQDDLVLIAGHTHRPVFKSMSHEDKVADERDQAISDLAAAFDMTRYLVKKGVPFNMAQELAGGAVEVAGKQNKAISEVDQADLKNLDKYLGDDFSGSFEGEDSLSAKAAEIQAGREKDGTERVFLSSLYRMMDRINERTAEMEGDGGKPPAELNKLMDRISEKTAEMQWIRAQQQMDSGDVEHEPLTEPCYFNTGCCCYSDGDITGIEISDGEIRLVKWPNSDGGFRPKVLEKATLESVFDSLI